jgi:hypothetical protein
MDLYTLYFRAYEHLSQGSLVTENITRKARGSGQGSLQPRESSAIGNSMKPLPCIFLLAVLPALSACSGSGAGPGPEEDYYIRAQVTLTDNSSFFFDQRAHIVIVSDDIWEISARDDERSISISIIWSRSFVTGPGTYDADAGLDELQMWIGRPHPFEPGEMRLSTVTSGQITFHSVDYVPDHVLSGTFDNVLLERTDPDDTVHITLAAGSFSVIVP